MKKLQIIKNEIVEKTIKPAIDFIKEIKPTDKIVIVHDDDCDGVCSGAIFTLIIRKLFNYCPKNFSTEWNESLTNNIVKEILKENVTYLIILDVPKIPQDLIDLLSKKIKILIIDHHIVSNYKNVLYCNPRVFDSLIYLPVSYLAYKIYEKIFESKNICWVAAIGVLGDYKIDYCQDLFIDLEKIYPRLVDKIKLSSKELFEKSLLGKLTRIVDGGRVVKSKEGAEFVLKTISNAKNYEEILKGKTKEAKTILKWYKISKKEFERLIKDFKQNNKPLGNSILFYEFKSKFFFKSTLATAIGHLYDDKIVFIGQKIGKYFDGSFRKGKNVNVDLNSLVRKLIENIPNSSGGGHPDAAGVRIPVEYKKVFLENLSKI